MEILKYFLMPLGWLYGRIMSLRNSMYNSGLKKAEKVNVPVISVGNISAGGTGKTPMAELLLRFLQKSGRKPAYLSRGYGRKTQGYLLVDPEGTPDTFGDEALQVASKFPDLAIAVCENRISGAKQLISEGKCDVLVLDDAFQHRRIARDLDLVMIDGSCPPHEDFVIPAGRLREFRSGLKRADFLIFNKVFDSNRQQELALKYKNFSLGFVRIQPGVLIPFSRQKTGKDIGFLQGKPVFAFSGLGNNHSFHTVIEKSGGKMLGKIEFSDHHSFSDTDLAKILDKFESSKSKGGEETLLLTSEKDYFRIRKQVTEEFRQKAWYLQIELDWVLGEEEFDYQINKTLQLKNG